MRFASSAIDDREIDRLLASGESDRVEFKESLDGSSARAVREAVCAFANDLPGNQRPGVVFIGVRDDGTHAGLKVTDRLLTQLAGIKTEGDIVPPPTIAVQKHRAPIGDVAVLVVTPSDSPPVRYRGRIHVRVGPRRAIATVQDERILNERRKSYDAPFDVSPIPGTSVADLDLAFFENVYLPQAFALDVLEANNRSRNEQLVATKMVASIDEPVATVLGILTLGKNPQDFLPGAYVQFVKFDGSESSDPIVDSEAIRGALADVIRRIDEKLASHNRVTVDATSGHIEKRVALYPLAALQQITRNAVMHRTYESTNAPVHIRWFEDRVEVLSPGGPYGIVTPKNFGNPGLVDYRNPNLAESLRNLGYVQRFGIGIQIARSELQAAGNPELMLSVEQNSVMVEIPSIPTGILSGK